jgi:hypothetical protein
MFPLLTIVCRILLYGIGTLNWSPWTQQEYIYIYIYIYIDLFVIKPDESPLVQWNNASETVWCRLLPVCQVPKETVYRLLSSQQVWLWKRIQFSAELNMCHVRVFIICKKNYFLRCVICENDRVSFINKQVYRSPKWSDFWTFVLIRQIQTLSSTCLDVDGVFRPLEEKELLACHYSNYWYDTDYVYMAAL